MTELTNIDEDFLFALKTLILFSCVEFRSVYNATANYYPVEFRAKKRMLG